MKNPPLVPDGLWEAIEPLPSQEPPRPKGCRPRVPDRAVLGGIVFALRTGCPCRLLPKELGCGSGVTCWLRSHARTTARGVVLVGLPPARRTVGVSGRASDARQRADRLSADERAAIRALSDTKSLRSLAADFSVSHETIRAVLTAAKVV